MTFTVIRHVAKALMEVTEDCTAACDLDFRLAAARWIRVTAAVDNTPRASELRGKPKQREYL